MESTSSNSTSSTLRGGPMMNSEHNSQHPLMKRIIVFCDGTGQDGLSQDRAEYTNILRLMRSVNYQDDRKNPPIPQLVSYEAGVGSDGNLYSQIIDAATATTIVEKIESGYGFIAQNYQPGDEIFLFGFSRGAYTARVIATLIGEIGLLDRKDMDSFADIFKAYKKLGTSKDVEEIEKLKGELFRWTDPKSAGKQRADPDGDGFTIKCLGVFDTVGSVGLPEEVTMTRAIHPLFGISDRTLGKHVERVYHALALDEDRADWNCIKFEQTEAGKQKGQILNQCWFSGSHSDIGGGFAEHDLADLTLIWMASHMGDILSLDFDYLATFPQPVAPWGKQMPHNPRTGVLAAVAIATPREPPSTDIKTAECVHQSVLEQKSISEPMKDFLLKHPESVYRLTPLEEQWKRSWPYDPQSPQARNYNEQAIPKIDEAKTTVAKSSNWKGSMKDSKNTTSVKRGSLLLRFMGAIGVSKEVNIPSPPSKGKHRRLKTQG